MSIPWNYPIHFHKIHPQNQLNSEFILSYLDSYVIKSYQISINIINPPWHLPVLSPFNPKRLASKSILQATDAPCADAEHLLGCIEVVQGHPHLSGEEQVMDFRIYQSTDISLGFHGLEFDLMGFNGIYRLFFFGAGTEMRSWTLRPALQFGAAGSAVQKWLTRRNPNTDIFLYIYGDGSRPWYLVNPKIAGKWMFIPLKMVLI